MMFFASQLAFLASVTSYGTIFFVLICLFTMVFVIKKYRLMEFAPSFSSVVRVPVTATEQCLSKVELPFSIVPAETTVLNSDNDIKLTIQISSQVRHTICVFTEVPWPSLQQVMSKPWDEFMNYIRSLDSSTSSVKCLAEYECSDTEPITVTKKLQADDGFNYPFVVIQAMDKPEYCDETSSVGALVTLVQVSVSADQRATPSVIGQFLKLFTGRVLTLQRLYPSAGDFREETDCVICWSERAARVLLPCRHACICNECLKRIRNCPVCRTHIVSHFSL